MADQDRPRRVLFVVACGGRPAGDLPAFVHEAQASGWEVCVIATPSALKFMDLDRLARLTGHVVRYDYKQPDEPDVLPPADAMVVAPATFNTINKWAAGISDTLALGLLNEAVGLGLPVVAVPSPTSPLPSIPPSGEAWPNWKPWASAWCSIRTPTRFRRRTSARRAVTCSPGRPFVTSLPSSLLSSPLDAPQPVAETRSPQVTVYAEIR